MPCIRHDFSAKSNVMHLLTTKSNKKNSLPDVKLYLTLLVIACAQNLNLGVCKHTYFMVICFEWYLLALWCGVEIRIKHLCS